MSSSLVSLPLHFADPIHPGVRPSFLIFQETFVTHEGLTSHHHSPFSFSSPPPGAGGPGPGGDGGRREKVQKGEQVQIVGTLTVGLREVRSNSVPLANGEPQCKSTPSPTPQFKNFPNPDTFQFSLFSGSFVYKLS